MRWKQTGKLLSILINQVKKIDFHDCTHTDAEFSVFFLLGWGQTKKNRPRARGRSVSFSGSINETKWSGGGGEVRVNLKDESTRGFGMAEY